MNNKKLAILIIILALLFLGAIVFFLFFYDFGVFKRDIGILRREKEAEEEIREPEQEIRQIVREVPQTEAKAVAVPDEKEIALANLRKLASSFAERFGSYSNHSDYENITDLKVFMSAEMSSWADEFIKESREKGNYAGIYQGVITKAISSEIKSSDASKSQVLIKTQRTKSSATTSNFAVDYEDILVSFVKEDGEWKVDSAYWQ